MSDTTPQAGAGEPQALLKKAVALAMGVGAPQSWAGAAQCLRAAAAAGSASARAQLAILAPDGGEVRPDEWAAPLAKRVLSTSPRVVAIDGFLSAAACDWIVARAAPHLTAAKVYGPDGAASGAGSSRTNSAFEFGFGDLDVVLVMARAKIAAAIGAPLGALEPPQVLSYEVGQSFHRHHDFLDPALPGHAADIARHGQRAVTFLTYLNANFEGGETDFPLLGLRHKGGRGDALYFANLDAAGVGDRRTVHEGRAPTAGRKWLLSQWIRNRARV